MSAAEPTSGEQGSLNLGVSHSADTPSEPTTVSAAETGASVEVPVSEPVMSEPSMSEPSLSSSAPSDSTKVEAVKAEAKPAEAIAPASRPEAAKEEISQLPGKVIVMSRENRTWTDSGIHSEQKTDEQGSGFGKRRIAAIAAVLALASAVGAVGGALATASFMHGTSDVAAAVTTSQSSPMQASLSRIEGDIQALKAGLEHTSKLGMSQFNKATDRLDKLERAQAEPAAKLAKLSEAIDRLHALPVPPPAVAAAAPAASTVAKDTTGSIPSAPQQQVAAAKSDNRTDIKGDMKSEAGRLPTLDDWVLRDVAYGGAVIGGRRGAYEVYAGDYIPGLGRIDAIRRQDGRWVVVTSRGLIVAR